MHTIDAYYHPVSLRAQPMQTSETNQPAPADYYACLLRLWREGAGGVWRASLQLTEGGERVGFADLEQLLAYLWLLISDTPDACGTAITTVR